MPNFTIIYDTYCAWCYGAAPVLEALLDTGKTKLFHYYLFQGGNAHRMADGFGTHAAVIDARISLLTGQPFGAAYKRNILQSETAVLDSTLAAQAAYLAHELGPEAESKLAAMLQRGYFVEGRSTQDAAFISDSLASLGISGKKLRTPKLENAAQERAAEAARINRLAGSQGVPTVLRHAETTEIVDLSQFYHSPTDISKLAA